MKYILICCALILSGCNASVTSENFTEVIKHINDCLSINKNAAFYMGPFGLKATGCSERIK